jgi:hypothetical protein
MSAEPLTRMPFRPDKPIPAGFLGSFALYLFSALAGRHDRDLISLTRQAVNNPNRAMQSDRGVLSEKGVVSKNQDFRDSRIFVSFIVGILLVILFPSDMATMTTLDSRDL